MGLVIGTKNHGKIKEFRELLADLGIEVFGLDDFTDVVEPAETGATFADNASLKARYYALQTGSWALSDDSGLEVEALGGAPGVLSARYAGEKATDAERARKLLAELAESPGAARRARFVCVIALADQTGTVKFEATGVCNGEIADAMRGENGFGYDPIFVPEGYEQTFGELSSATKREISHRAQAIKKIIGFLRDFTAHELDQ